jgi:hypothetical protein
VPRIAGAPLATLCLAHCAPAETCGCLQRGGSSVLDPNAVRCMSSYAAGGRRGAPNLMVTTGGGELKLISVEEEESGGGGGGGGGGGEGGGVTMTLVASVLLTEGAFGYAFPAGERGDRLGACVMWRDPADEPEPQTETESGGAETESTEAEAEAAAAGGSVSAAAAAGGGRRWAPITAAVVSSVNGQLCFIKVSPNTNATTAAKTAPSSFSAASTASASPSAAAAAAAAASYACCAELRRTVTPHLPGAGHAKKHGSRTCEAALWESGPGGAAVVSVGSDGNLVVTHFKVGLYKLNSVDPEREGAWFHPLNLNCDLLVSTFAFTCNLYRYIKGGECAAEHDNAWQCVSREKSGAHMLAVCSRSGVAVTASQDEDEVHVWDLAAERRLRKVKMG